jgi:DNA topoisomerase-6 subunit B
LSKSKAKKTKSRRGRSTFASSNGRQSAAESPAVTNGKPRRRRATAESMASKQQDISVSEFFAKNRHLLGFDNPRKALLTTVKEAVDNSLDACEEAAISAGDLGSHSSRRLPIASKSRIQDNGPGIMKKQIPLIFGKLLYGSKFHRLRMSRGQQGIGISAAGMYGMLTTGKPVKILSKVSVRESLPTTTNCRSTRRKTNQRSSTDEAMVWMFRQGEAGRKYIQRHGIEWDAYYDPDEEKGRLRKFVAALA